jgi:hypothetical protein
MAVDLGISLFASTGILLSLATITTSLRCIARIYIAKNFGLDDWLMVLTLVSRIASSFPFLPPFTPNQLMVNSRFSLTTAPGSSTEGRWIKVDPITKSHSWMSPPLSALFILQSSLSK